MKYFCTMMKSFPVNDVIEFFTWMSVLETSVLSGSWCCVGFDSFAWWIVSVGLGMFGLLLAQCLVFKA